MAATEILSKEVRYIESGGFLAVWRQKLLNMKDKYQPSGHLVLAYIYMLCTRPYKRIQQGTPDLVGQM